MSMDRGPNKRRHCYLDERKRASAPEVSIKGDVESAGWCNCQRAAGRQGLELLWSVVLQVSVEKRCYDEVYKNLDV